MITSAVTAARKKTPPTLVEHNIDECSGHYQISKDYLALATNQKFLDELNVIECLEDVITVGSSTRQIGYALVVKAGDVECNLFYLTGTQGQLATHRLMALSQSNALKWCQEAFEEKRQMDTVSVEKYLEQRIKSVEDFYNYKTSSPALVQKALNKKIAEQKRKEEFEANKDHQNLDAQKDRLRKKLEEIKDKEYKENHQRVIDELKAKFEAKNDDIKDFSEEDENNGDSIFGNLFDEEEEVHEEKLIGGPHDYIHTGNTDEEMKRAVRVGGPVECDKELITDLYAELIVANLLKGIFVSVQNVIECSSQVVAGTIIRAKLSFGAKHCNLKVFKPLPHTGEHPQIYHANAPENSPAHLPYIKDHEQPSNDLPNCADALESAHARRLKMHFE